MWMPRYESFDSSWSDGKEVGYFDVNSSTKPTYISKEIEQYYNYILNIDAVRSNIIQKNDTRFLGKYLDPLGIKYLIFHNDIPILKRSSKKALEKLNSQKDLSLFKQDNSIHIFENKNYSNQLYSPKNNILVVGGLNVLSLVNSIEDFSMLDYSFVFLEQSLFGNKIENLSKLSDIIIFNNKNSEDLAFSFIDGKYLIAPFDFAIHHDINKWWSKATTSDLLHGPFHSYLQRRGEVNWDFDYGKGLVLTSASARLENEDNIKISEKDNIKKYDFEDGSTQSFKSESSFLNLSADKEKSKGKFSLKGQLSNRPKSGQVLASSEKTDIEENTGYRYNFDLSAKNINKIDFKVIYYNDNNEAFDSKYIINNQKGDFEYINFSKNIIAPPGARKINIQIISQNVQNTEGSFWIDNFNIYNLEKYTALNKLEMEKEVSEDAEYDLYMRYFENTQGGEVFVSLDDLDEIKINMQADINNFVWRKIGTFNLERGKHKINLQNRNGFNAVSTFALVPKDKIEEYNSLSSNIVNKLKNVFMFCPETALDYQNNEELVLNKGIQTKFNIAKDGKYKLALEANTGLNKGSVEVEFGDQKKTVELDSPDEEYKWFYLENQQLNKGENELKLKPTNLHSVLQTETEEQINNLWSIENSSKEDSISLSIDYNKENDPILKADLEKVDNNKGWNTVSLEPIETTKDEKYNVTYKLDASNINNIHSKVIFYDNKDQVLDSKILVSSSEGSFDFQDFDASFKSPAKSHKFVIQILSKNSTTSKSSWLLDDFSVTEWNRMPQVTNVVLYEESADESFSDIFENKKSNIFKLTYEKINSTKYKVHVEGANSPFTLALAESYDPLWTAKIDNTKIQPIPLYSVINGFPIDQQGSFDLIIEYEPQKYFYFGLLISLVTLAFCIGYMIFYWLRKKV